MTPRVGVVGGINMDIHLFGAEQLGDGFVVAEHYLAEPGGKGANQARAAARLGAEVLLIGAVGSDEFGRDCVEAVEADGVDASHVLSIEDDRTGFVVIDLVQGHHVTRVFVPGANHRLVWGHVQPALPALRTCDAVVAQAEVPSVALEALSDWAADQGIPLFLDPTPPHSVPIRVLQAAEAITPNRGEVGGLTGRSIAGAVDARLAARDLLELGARLVCLKLGEGGTMIAAPDGFQTIPTAPVEVIDETGGGDVFMAALVASRLSGADWPEAVAFANAAGAVSVSKAGLHLPSRTEVVEALDRIPH